MPLCVIIISAPLALVNSISPSESAAATISPIDSLLIALIVSVAFVTLEKFIALPFILIFDAAVEASVTSISRETRLWPVAVTLVDDETALIAIAFAAADALSDAPISISLIFMSCEAVRALVDTKSDLITVLESTSLKPNLAKSSILPLFDAYPFAVVLASTLTNVPSTFSNLM